MPVGTESREVCQELRGTNSQVLPSGGDWLIPSLTAKCNQQGRREQTVLGASLDGRSHPPLSPEIGSVGVAIQEKLSGVNSKEKS